MTFDVFWARGWVGVGMCSHSWKLLKVGLGEGGMGFRFHSTTLSVVIYQASPMNDNTLAYLFCPPDSSVNFLHFLQLSQDLFKVHQIFRKILWISCRASFRSSSFFPGFFRCPAEKKTKDPKCTRKTQRDLFEVPQALKPRDFCTPPKFNIDIAPEKLMGLENYDFPFWGPAYFQGLLLLNFQGVSWIQTQHLPLRQLEISQNQLVELRMEWAELGRFFFTIFSSFEYSTESVLERMFDVFLCGFWCWYLVFWDLQDGMFLTFLKADVSQRCLQGCKFGNNSFNSTLQLHTSKNHNQINEYTETSHPKLTEKTRQPTWNHSIVTCYPLTLPLRLIGVLIGMHLLIGRIPKRVNVNMGRVGLVQGTTCSKERVSSCSCFLRRT